MGHGETQGSSDADRAAPEALLAAAHPLRFREDMPKSPTARQYPRQRTSRNHPRRARRAGPAEKPINKAQHIRHEYVGDGESSGSPFASSRGPGSQTGKENLCTRAAGSHHIPIKLRLGNDIPQEFIADRMIDLHQRVVPSSEELQISFRASRICNPPPISKHVIRNGKKCFSAVLLPPVTAFRIGRVATRRARSRSLVVKPAAQRNALGIPWTLAARPVLTQAAPVAGRFLRVC